MKIGVQIKMYREKYHYSQIQLAEELCITRQAISNWERGLSEPDLASIEKMAAIFNVSMETFINEKSAATKQNELLKIVLWLYLICITLFVLLGMSVVYLQVSLSSLLLPFIMMLMSSTLFVVFGNAIRTQDFSMISGYDDSLHYNVEVQCKILTHILLQIMFGHVFVNALYIIFIWSHLSLYSIVFLGIYILNFMGSIVMTHYKYKNALLIREEDRRLSKKMMPITSLFIGQTIFILAMVFLTFHIYGIANNTKEALLVLAFMMVSVIISIATMLYGVSAIKKGKKLSKKYYLVPSLAVIVTVICMVLFPYG